MKLQMMQMEARLQGREEGRKEAWEEALMNTIQVEHEFGSADDIIVKKLMKVYHIPVEAAENYLQKSKTQ